MGGRRESFADRTENSHLVSGTHGRDRRQQRSIEKVDLQRARRYGMAETQANGRIKYTYGGIVFIYDPHKNREITSFAAPDVASNNAGTKCSQPIQLAKMSVPQNQIENNKLMQRDPRAWKSHSVLVIDMSGSMRRDDVNGARCRSDGIFLTLARDYIKKQLDDGTSSSHDVVSVVIMKEDATTPILIEPLSCTLYNKLVDMREWSELRPSGPGNYMPALEIAETLIMISETFNKACALSLMFFSDGRPSDRGPFAEVIGRMASKFRRRLTVCCIGMAEAAMAEDAENFVALQDMVTEAEAYGAVASFSKPSMHTDSLSNIMTSLATSLTTSKTEMTDLKTGKSKALRTDVLRERRGTPDDDALTLQWIPYRSTDKKQFVRRIWSWSSQKNDFLHVIDPRCVCCYKKSKRGFKCGNCKICLVCKVCKKEYHQYFIQEHYKKDECYTALKSSRTGLVVSKDICSFSVAMKEPIFDEGAERIVHKFRYMDEHDQFIGPKMVAKQSRFVENDGSYEDRMSYHREFLRTQSLASRFADLFNEEIDALVDHFKDTEWIRKLPRIKFLEPLVIEVIKDGKEVNILIESELEGTYEKFNNNMGFVKGQNKHVQNGKINDLSSSLNQLGLGFNQPEGLGAGLGAIEEGSEEEEEEEEGNEEEEEEENVATDAALFDATVLGPESGSYLMEDLHEKYFPQAFSHYSYEKSKHKLMVVDLQGVFKVESDGTQQYMLTDPVIHKRRGKGKNKQSKQLESWTFGRTDRGEKGMKAFFDTHVCSGVCRLLGLEPQKPN
eukprot:CAMPEP_0198294472 /NCGR_PEP_ID=MMETSP1449-20131203/22509_1 /TAXON_ID=420275 /ORGANISM="Attheya septentrionalis, Strain CCMP2084" /LENGTH=784 /DNA_ID=CAMNT_0043994431 /DNA_START=44 /DNA_END=2398 /DNA_ORIENTATION=-